MCKAPLAYMVVFDLRWASNPALQSQVQRSTNQATTALPSRQESAAKSLSLTSILPSLNFHAPFNMIFPREQNRFIEMFLWYIFFDEVGAECSDVWMTYGKISFVIDI